MGAKMGAAAMKAAMFKMLIRGIVEKVTNSARGGVLMAKGPGSRPGTYMNDRSRMFKINKRNEAKRRRSRGK